MRFDNVAIAGVAALVPPRRATSADLEARLAPAYRALSIAPGTLAHLTGIQERRYWGEVNLSGSAAEAGRLALAKSGLEPASIDTLIYGGVCREFFEPATAVSVAASMGRAGANLGLGRAVFDISNACLGMVSGMVEVATQISAGQIEAGLVVGAETAAEIVGRTIDELNADPTHERFRFAVATLTGGAGAAAVLLSRATLAPRAPRLLGCVSRSAPEHHALCRWGLRPEGEHLRPFAHTDAMGILRHGVEVGRSCWQEFTQTMDWGASTIDRSICHQVGQANREHILKETGLEAENDYVTYDRFGNTGSTALPSALAWAMEDGFVSPGHRIALMGIGSGLNASMLGVEW